MNILDGKGDAGKCLKPCSRMKFESTIKTNDPHEKEYGLFIEIEDKVKVLQSKLTINEVTLVTRIGGIIGVGKEFLWITILVFGSTVNSLKVLKVSGKNYH